jgi:hypothetical protein
VTSSYEKLLDAAYENKPLSEVLGSSLAAPTGASGYRSPARCRKVSRARRSSDQGTANSRRARLECRRQGAPRAACAVFGMARGRAALERQIHDAMTKRDWYIRRGSAPGGGPPYNRVSNCRPKVKALQ